MRKSEVMSALRHCAAGNCAVCKFEGQDCYKRLAGAALEVIKKQEGKGTDVRGVNGTEERRKRSQKKIAQEMAAEMINADMGISLPRQNFNNW